MNEEEQRQPVHTLVLHKAPDLEVLFMAWLIVVYMYLREKLGVTEEPQFKFISSGPLRKEDWRGEAELSARALERKGFLFLDCGGGGGRLDQHGHKDNRGRGQAVVASIDLMAKEVGVCEAGPGLKLFVRLVSASDRTGESLCPIMVVDKGSEFPHVPRDIRNMVVALNERYPDQPEIVQETFFQAMDGLHYLLNRFLDARADLEDMDVEKIEDNLDLREMYFMTVDNAIEGMGQKGEDLFEIELFWKTVKAAWQQREEAWQEAAREVRKARSLRIPYRHKKGVRGIKLLWGYSGSKYFSVAARRKQADVVIQIYPDGRFMISRRGSDISFDRIARFLRLADAKKRRGRMVGLRNPAARGTTSHVEVEGQRISQFYYPQGGFAFGNRFATNPDGLAVSPLTEDNLVRMIIMALAGESLEMAIKQVR